MDEPLVAVDGDGLDVVLGRYIGGEVTYFSVDPSGHDRPVGTQDVKGGLGHPTLLGLEFGLLLVSVGDTGFATSPTRTNALCSCHLPRWEQFMLANVATP